jgi:radical SAM protein with 4Fe4S-binding SPASM domain
MSPRPLSVIVLPTLDCNAACDYCFEEKAAVSLSLERVPLLAERLLDHMQAQGVAEARVYWQGGEVSLLGPAWFERAHQAMGERAERRGLSFRHELQTNLLAWDERWRRLVLSMFGGSLGTSMDHPNHHRRTRGGSTQDYDAAWRRNVRRAMDDGIQVGVIAVAHAGTLDAGAARFYDFFVDEVGLCDLQLNTPFPGGPARGLWPGEPLDVAELARFTLDLMDLWMERGRERGVRLAPFEALVDRFRGRPSTLPCIWQQCCADEFFAVGPAGSVALCDCWVASHPEASFGNLFGETSLTTLLEASPARREFLRRPETLLAEGECASCRHLQLCHGGCPVRSQAATGTALARDPYCALYLAMFDRAQQHAGAETQRQLGLISGAREVS